MARDRHGPVSQRQDATRLRQQRPLAGMQQPVAAHLHEAFGQHVGQKAADEGVNRQRGPLLRAGLAVGIAERHFIIGDPLDAVVAECDAENVGARYFKAVAPLPTGRQSTTQGCFQARPSTSRNQGV